MSRPTRFFGVARKGLCIGSFLVGAFASSVVSAQDLSQRLRVEEGQSADLRPIASGFELVVARNILKSGESFRFQTRRRIALTHSNDVGSASKSFADGDVMVRVSRDGGNNGEAIEQDAGSEWRLRQPGVYQAVARHTQSKVRSNTVLLEVVELKLVQPQRSSDGRFELLAERLGGRGARNEPVHLEVTSGTGKEIMSGVLGQPIKRSFGVGKHRLRASSQYQGVSLTSELSFVVPPLFVVPRLDAARLELAAPEQVEADRYRFRAGMRGGQLEVTAVQFDVTSGTSPRKSFAGTMDEPVERSVGESGECTVVAHTTYRGAELRSDSRRFTVPEVVLDLAQPERVADGRFRFLANLRGGKPGPSDRGVTFKVECNSEQGRFRGLANDAIVHDMSARGTCVATATMDHDGRLVVSERRQFAVPSSDPSWSQWLLLLTVLGGLIGAGCALKRRQAEGDSPESADIEGYVHHVAHRILPRRTTVDLTSGSAPRLVLRVTKGTAPPCVEYRSS